MPRATGNSGHKPARRVVLGKAFTLGMAIAPVIRRCNVNRLVQVPKLNTGVRFPSSALAKCLVDVHFLATVWTRRAYGVPRAMLDPGVSTAVRSRFIVDSVAPVGG